MPSSALVRLSQNDSIRKWDIRRRMSTWSVGQNRAASNAPGWTQPPSGLEQRLWEFSVWNAEGFTQTLWAQNSKWKRMNWPDPEVNPKWTESLRVRPGALRLLDAHNVESCPCLGLGHESEFHKERNSWSSSFLSPLLSFTSYMFWKSVAEPQTVHRTLQAKKSLIESLAFQMLSNVSACLDKCSDV